MAKKIDWTNTDYRAFLDKIQEMVNKYRDVQRQISSLNEQRKNLEVEIENMEIAQAECISEDRAKVICEYRNRVSNLKEQAKTLKSDMPKFTTKNFNGAYEQYKLEFFKGVVNYTNTAKAVVTAVAWEYGVTLDESIAKNITSIMGSKVNSIKKYDETGLNLSPVSKNDFGLKIHMAIIDRFTESGLKSTKELKKKAEGKAKKRAEYEAKKNAEKK